MPTCPTTAPPPPRERTAGRATRPSDLRHLVVIGHPDPASFNHAVAERYRLAVQGCGQSVVVRDLYADGFDPLLKAEERPGVAGFRLSDDVRAELAAVAGAAVIVLVYPVWFGMPPAIIKGYVERVLGAGLLPHSARPSLEQGPVAGKDMLILSTSASTRPWLEENGQWTGLRQGFDRCLETIFHLAAVDHLHADAIVTPLLPSYAGECLTSVEEQARRTCARLLAASHARAKEALLSRHLVRQTHDG